MSDAPATSSVVQIPARWWGLFCLLIAGLLFAIRAIFPPTANLLAAEFFSVILALFIFGSIRYQIDKNALTYGALLVIFSTFFPLWWPQSEFRGALARQDIAAFWTLLRPHLTLSGLEKLVHADTLLFILGLTFFVAAIAQTRLLEAISFNLLRVFRGRLFPTVAAITAGVALASGILDGVSMVGLMIRVIVILMTAARLARAGLIFAVLTSVVVTTVCGMWLAYGEPPNLIMKSNLGLADTFFLVYTLPLAAVALLVVIGFVRTYLRDASIAPDEVDRLLRQEAAIGDVMGRGAKRWGLIAFAPFVVLLLWHARNHTVPLFASSFAGFACAMLGLSSAARRDACHEAVEEYKEYLFLIPLFLSITMLSAVHFFDPIQVALRQTQTSPAHLAAIQFIGSGLLSALLDNNVVADFASRAIDGLPDMLLYAAAQIAGYATGGCLTHIGSAQSVVAYAYIRRLLHPGFTPWAWIRAIWKLIAAISVCLTLAIYLMAYFAS
jgi:Na+/H+ antiporter NhaD/arsenite permease-like protein